MVHAGFRDCRRDIPDPPPSQQAPDQTMKKAWMLELKNKFLQLLEKQEKKDFKDLATLRSLLSFLPKPAQGSARTMSVAKAMEAGFLPTLDEDQADMFIGLHQFGVAPRQWPKVSDFVARFCTLRESKNLRPCENRVRFWHGRRFFLCGVAASRATCKKV